METELSALPVDARGVEILDRAEVGRRGWQLVGLLAAHVGLGLLTFGIVFADIMDKYLFCATPQSLAVASWASFVGWFVAAAVVVGMWIGRQGFAWAASLVWTAVSLTTMLTIIAIEPARDCGFVF